MTGFRNAKSILLGDDTHTASLAGTVSGSLTSIAAPRGDIVNTIDISSLGRRTLATWVIPFTSPINRVTFNVQVFVSKGNNNSVVVGYIRRDNPDTGTIIAQQSTGTGGSATLTLSGTDENVGSGGSVTYFYTLDVTVFGGSVVQYGTYDINPNGYVIHTSVADTHTATLAGSNTQDTVEENVIR